MRCTGVCHRLASWVEASDERKTREAESPATSAIPSPNANTNPNTSPNANTNPAPDPITNPSMTLQRIGLAHREPATCPACGEVGTLEGEDDSDTDYAYELDEDGESMAVATIHVPSEYFSCPNCRLVLDGYELIDHVGLPGIFDVIDDNPEWPEPDYGND